MISIHMLRLWEFHIKTIGTNFQQLTKKEGVFTHEWNKAIHEKVISKSYQINDLCPSIEFAVRYLNILYIINCVNINDNLFSPTQCDFCKGDSCRIHQCRLLTTSFILLMKKWELKQYIQTILTLLTKSSTKVLVVSCTRMVLLGSC